ncbi:MAG TPA: hypothetical protein VKU37_03550 [Verrucomicrobiae bacterium]|nr:hypothetical protein [Verrucomicrobiae bacterium]
MDDETFLRQFESTAWPKAEWHHRQHIKVAYLYVRRYSLETAAIKIRENIKAYNAAHNVEDTLLNGYHDTMTQAWLRLVHFTLCEYGPAENADAFFEQHPQLSQKQALRFFYSKERFTSPEAKAAFVPPDLAPLPESRKPIENSQAVIRDCKKV